MKSKVKIIFQTKYFVFSVICIAQLMETIAQGSYSPIISILMKEWSLTAANAGLIASAYQAGYVFAVIPFGFLSDKFNARKIYAICAIETGLAGIAFAFLAHNFPSAVILRAIIGIGYGGLCVPGMKFVTQWFAPHERGKALGIYTCSIAIGGAVPLYVMGPTAIMLGWKLAVMVVSAFALVGAVLVVTLAKDKPISETNDNTKEVQLKSIKISTLWNVLTQKHLLLINLSYMCHMWEYIAFNNWISPFMVAVALSHGFQSDSALIYGNAIAATAILAEAPAVSFGGIISDKIGRTKTIMLALLVSACCSFIIGWLINSPLMVLIIALVLTAGFFILMDSAVFKAGITEMAEQEYIGLALSVQSFLGFGTGIISPAVFGWVLGATNPNIVGSIEFHVWGWAFLVLSIGALGGIVPSYFLRRCPESVQMAGGKR